MSRSALRPVPPQEEEFTPRRRRAEALPPPRKSAPQAKASPRPRDPEALFRWRILGGLMSGFLFTPYLATCLLAPHLTGSSGVKLSELLVLWFGRTAWLLPIASGVLAGSWLGGANPRWGGLRWGGGVLLLDLVVMAGLLDGQGGLVGSFLVDGLVFGVGPVGAWLLVVLGFLGGVALIWQLTLEELQGGLSQAWELSEAIARGLLKRGWQLGSRLWARGPSAGPRAGTSAGEALPPVATGERRGAGRGLPLLPSGSGERALGGQAPLEEIPEAEPLDEPLREASWAEEELPPSEEELPPSEEELPPSEEETQPWDEGGLPSWEEEPGPAPVGGQPPVEEVPPPPWESSAESEVAGPGAPAPSPGEPSLVGASIEPGGQLRLFPGAAGGPPLARSYRLPPLSLLDDGPRHRRTRPVEDKSQILVDTLDSFGVKAKVVNVVQGPTVTRYELQPARGVKVSKFTSLTNDIALALAAVSVRIEAPIPGKAAIGIEVPNLSTELVVLKDLLSSERYRKGGGLCLGLGKDISGDVQVADLQKMPHLLVAGTTGSGKSVCVNTLILSLIYRFTPRRLQLLMIDPKQVELSIYEGLPHLVGLSGEDSGRILVDPKKAAMALKQVVDLMEARYTLFARARVRNLKEYNDQAEEALPWMVVIIDELADLMMVASKTVETSICRLAQKARAAGIHLVVATQRPSTDVITGLIKVNIPSRVAFAVSSGVDSRVILDTGGAEQLLGKGDMLFLPVDASEPRRVQGAYVTNEEILRVVEFWRDQSAPENRIELEVVEGGAEEAPAEGEEDSGDDGLVEEALQVVLRCQQASASMLQTELKVGYARARRLLTILERRGHVGPADGSKPRKILYQGGDV